MVWVPVVDIPFTSSFTLVKTGPSFFERVATAFVFGSNPILERVVFCVTVGVTLSGYTKYGAGAPASFVTVNV
jgi:hypothetical protein